MVLLLDANLSWRLTDPLKSHFGKVYHAEHLDLNQPAKDIELWEFACQEDATIVSNDNDFYKLSLIKGFPPKVVILRTGNQSNKYLLDLIIKHKNDILDLYKSNEYGLLEIM
jgi:predicted nuclease of predicted toxin-antitoxin system